LSLGTRVSVAENDLQCGIKTTLTTPGFIADDG